jgi:sterol desaturase/sphingolipid hydroxylase (fatty acid hydroxylase superfamily)
MSTTDARTTAAIDASADAPAAPAARPVKQQTLAEAARFFSAKATPRLFIPIIVVVAAVRLRIGDVSWRDLVVVAGILAIEPLTEWAIHVYVLHFKPRKLGRFTLDLHAAKKHRFHHRNPNDPDTAFVPLGDLALMGPVVFALLALVTWGDGARLTTAVLTALVMLVTYEWTHYLIHTAYKPKGRYYRYIWRAHRLHHFKNEDYWMGVTIHLADHVLGTFPQKSEVENSPTARTLGIDVA